MVVGDNAVHLGVRDRDACGGFSLVFLAGRGASATLLAGASARARRRRGAGGRWAAVLGGARCSGRLRDRRRQHGIARRPCAVRASGVWAAAAGRRRWRRFLAARGARPISARLREATAGPVEGPASKVCCRSPTRSARQRLSGRASRRAGCGGRAQTGASAGERAASRSVTAAGVDDKGGPENKVIQRSSNYAAERGPQR